MFTEGGTTNIVGGSESGREKATTLDLPDVRSSVRVTQYVAFVQQLPSRLSLRRQRSGASQAVRQIRRVRRTMRPSYGLRAEEPHNFSNPRAVHQHCGTETMDGMLVVVEAQSRIPALSSRRIVRTARSRALLPFEGRVATGRRACGVCARGLR